MTPTWITRSQNAALAASGAWRSMETPKFQTAIPDAKPMKSRLVGCARVAREAEAGQGGIQDERSQGQ
jgi:hypothetical protein